MLRTEDSFLSLADQCLQMDAVLRGPSLPPTRRTCFQLPVQPTNLEWSILGCVNENALSRLVHRSQLDEVYQLVHSKRLYLAESCVLKKTDKVENLKEICTNGRTDGCRSGCNAIDVCTDVFC